MKTKLKRLIKGMLWVFSLPIKRRQIRKSIIKIQSQNELVKIVIGSGGLEVKGWILTDLPVLDVLNVSHWQEIFPITSIDRVLAEHVFEHLTDEQFKQFLHNIRPYLAPNGRVRVAVPDGFHSSPAYIDYVRPGGSGAGADDHKILYTYKIMSDLLDECNYQYQFLEYFDENGQFHQSEWHVEDGLIRRSADHDRRNKDAPLSYTSLIVDFWVR